MFNVKKMKKPITFLLTLVMMFSMAASAFAAETVRATVNFFDETTQLWSTEQVTLPVMGIEKGYYDLEKYPEATNPCNGQTSVLDAIIAALDQVSVQQPAEQKLTHHIDWSPASVDSEGNITYPDGFFLDDVYVGDPSDGDNDFVSHNSFIPATETTPNISEGSGWNAYHDDSGFNAYLSNEVLQDGMTINFKYESYYYEW